MFCLAHLGGWFGHRGEEKWGSFRGSSSGEWWVNNQNKNKTSRLESTRRQNWEEFKRGRSIQQTSRVFEEEVGREGARRIEDERWEMGGKRREEEKKKEQKHESERKAQWVRLRL